MITKQQADEIYFYLLAQGKPVKRDVIARDLGFNEVKIRQARLWLMQNRNIAIVSDWQNGFYIASKSIHFDEDIRRRSRTAYTELRQVRLMRREQQRLREAEGVEVPENQLNLAVLEQAEQMLLEFSEVLPQIN